MRKATITQELTNAYQVWKITIPDDAPEDPDELQQWLEDNPMMWDYYDMYDQDYDMSEITSVDEVDPKPIPDTPRWWKKVYQELYKRDPDLLAKFVEKYGEE